MSKVTTYVDGRHGLLTEESAGFDVAYGCTGPPGGGRQVPGFGDSHRGCKISMSLCDPRQPDGGFRLGKVHLKTYTGWQGLAVTLFLPIEKMKLDLRNPYEIKNNARARSLGIKNKTYLEAKAFRARFFTYHRALMLVT